MFLFDIIEQFDMLKFCNCFETLDFYLFENMAIFLSIVVFSYGFITTKRFSIFNVFSKLFFNLLKINLKEKFQETHFSVTCVYFFYVLFMFIFWNNIVGMIPDVFTMTSFMVLPAYLSIMFFMASFCIVVYQTKFKLLKGFLPSGVPTLVQPFLFVIEFLSYFISLFSLAIRLFINMLAGHMLLKIFSTMSLMMVCQLHEIFLIEFFMNFMMIAFIFLEYVACFLQAIVFVSLIAIYMDHSLNFIH